MEPLIAYLHFLSFLLTAGLLTAELVVCRPGLGPPQVRLLARLDAAYFIAALAALATGLLRLLFYAKGVAFYLNSPFFWIKMALYLAVAALSIGPTLRFIRWNRAAGGAPAAPDPAAVAATRRLIHMELALLALMPLMAVLMARGVGR